MNPVIGQARDFDANKWVDQFNRGVGRLSNYLKGVDPEEEKRQRTRYEANRSNQDIYGVYQGFNLGFLIKDRPVQGFELGERASIRALFTLPEDLRATRAFDKQYTNYIYTIHEETPRNFVKSMYTIPYRNALTDAFNQGKTPFSFPLYRHYVLYLINQERQSQGVGPLVGNDYLQEGTTQRALELAQWGTLQFYGQKHLRPDGTSFRTAFPGDVQPYLGENILLRQTTGNPYEMVSEWYLAQVTFQQFKDSPAHYQNMIHPGWTTVTSDIKISQSNGLSKEYDEFGSYWFAVQIFS